MLRYYMPYMTLFIVIFSRPIIAYIDIINSDADTARRAFRQRFTQSAPRLKRRVTKRHADDMLLAGIIIL